MKVGTMRRLGIILFGGGLLLLVISFMPRPAEQSTPQEPVQEPPPAALTDLSPEQLANSGLALFQAKGCPSCHRHNAVTPVEFSTEMGPNLTNYTPDPEFVREWLRDPAAIRPNTEMPDLDLSEDEIEAIVAFLEE